MRTLWAFFRRDANIHTSYKLGFVMDLLGVFFTAATYYYVAKMFGAAAAPFLRAYGGDYFAFVLIGVAFAAYQNVGLNSFSQSLRQEQFLNTLEPLLVTPVSTPRSLFSGLCSLRYLRNACRRSISWTLVSFATARLTSQYSSSILSRSFVPSVFSPMTLAVQSTGRAPASRLRAVRLRPVRACTSRADREWR